MKVAVVAMGVMEVPGHEVVDVIPVRNRFVAAIRPMLVVRGMSIALMCWRTERRILVTLFDAMVVDVAVVVHVLQVPVMQEVTMSFVGDHRVSTPFVMHVVRMKIV